LPPNETLFDGKEVTSKPLNSKTKMAHLAVPVSARSVCLLRRILNVSAAGRSQK
jgi:hypothetical protein